VPIVDTDGGLVRLLTQADVVRFLAGHVDELGPMGNLTVGQLLPDIMSMGQADGQAQGQGQGAGTEEGRPNRRGSLDASPLVVAGLRDRAIEVLQKMRRCGAPAAAITDLYGAIVSNLSFSDLKLVARRANFSALSLPVQQFLGALDRGSETMNPSIVVKAATPLSSVLLTIAATKIHQLYFVDEQLHPVAAIRTGDVLRLLVKEAA
jgi:CBS-domain-containing membrane protein